MKYKLKTGGGDMIEEVVTKAKKIAEARKCTVEFEFNDVTVLVNEKSVIDWCVKAYTDSHIMGWKEIGPDYRWSYDADTEIELYSRRLAKAKQRKLDEAKSRIEADEQMRKLDSLVSGVGLEIHPDKKEDYLKCVEVNSKDGYSRCVIDYAEYWGKLMQIEISKGRKLRDVAEETQMPLAYMGITGFMYGAVVNVLSTFWLYGEELRRWHNKEYGVDEDTKGVVNPAVLTIQGGLTPNP